MMRNVLSIQPEKESIAIANSPSLAIAASDLPISSFKEIQNDTTLNTDWESFYERRYFRRSHKRLRNGMLKIDKICKKMLGKDDILFSDNYDSDREQEENATDGSNADVEERITQQENVQETDDDLLGGEDNDGTSEEVQETGSDLSGGEEDALDTNSEEVQETGGDLPGGEGGEEEALDTTSEELLFGDINEEILATSEQFGEGTKIHLLCTCGAQHQLYVTGSDCYLLIRPLEDSTEHLVKLVWASPNQFLFGLDCSCGRGFVLRKSGMSFSYHTSCDFQEPLPDS